MSSPIERRRLLLGGAALGALPSVASAQSGSGRHPRGQDERDGDDRRSRMGHDVRRRHHLRCRAPFRAAALSHGGRRDRRVPAPRPRAGPRRAGAALRRLRDRARRLCLPRRARPQGLDGKSADLACAGRAAPQALGRRSRRPVRPSTPASMAGATGRASARAIRRPTAARPIEPQELSTARRGSHRHHKAAVDTGTRARGRRAAALARAERLPAAQARDLRHALPCRERRLRMGDADRRPWPARSTRRARDSRRGGPTARWRSPADWPAGRLENAQQGRLAARPPCCRPAAGAERDQARALPAEASIARPGRLRASPSCCG